MMVCNLGESKHITKHKLPSLYACLLGGSVLLEKWPTENRGIDHKFGWGEGCWVGVLQMIPRVDGGKTGEKIIL